jgi:NADP-dependent 3-hydroxy acid dehydrogenase YdfG
MKNDISTGIVLITGGTSGLGLALVKLFLKKGYYVVAMGRQPLNLPGYEEKFKLFRIDFSDMDQVAIITKKICDLRKRYIPVPVMDVNKKKAFLKACFDIIDPFLNKVND